MSTNPVKILCLGAGAVGSYIGGSLALAGHQVVFAEQEKMAGFLRERGLRLDLSADKRRKAGNAFLLEPTSFVVASSLEEALRFGPFDLALFALKSFDTADALNEIKPFADKFPPVLCMSNGVENEPALARVLGEKKVIHGTLTSAIGRRGPGDILLEKLRGVGIAAGHPLSEQVVAICNDANLNAKVYEHAASMKWSKMLTNLLANPLSAILDLTPGKIFADARLFKLEVAVLRECMAVMKALDFEITDLPKTPVRALAFAAGLPTWVSRPLLARAVGSGRGRKMPSFHIDLHSGRGKSEVDYLHGAVVRAGQKTGVPTPVNTALTKILLSLTSGETPLDAFSQKPAMLLEKVNT